ncbi:hypothetical protein ASPACDRAFT_61660 [Aspergillus aculeatus ATCC 16872]|uniref:Uncharacterized protein n=1 Tax=Aspergillus aculeatus (strain ATCC 16872 / CBS 172.66 / WB 5094) TaxID=690307 RepID=A0A1L9WS16_ASPA1|nr:uncharacterized protein ASPACDRAFT_61660 [Aspergillus aculeatus ATCC 16872]OJJ98985.1 hypothetical protein ASPACDRAFT_61660 [Aspergillus aculeatus ATCC 16872]
MAKLTDIPPELMLHILEELYSTANIYALVRTSSELKKRCIDTLYKNHRDWVGVLLSAAQNGNLLTAQRAVQYDPMRDPEYDTSRVIRLIRRRLCQEAEYFGFDYYQVPYPDDSFDRNHPDDAIWPYRSDEFDLTNDRYDRLTLAENANMTHLAYTLAVGNDHLDIARALSPTGRPIDTVISRWGRTALHYAAYRGREQGIRFLLERGANVNATDSWDETALILAARHPSASCVELLLAEGATINACCDGRTAISYAVLIHADEVIEVLLAHDADLNVGVVTPLLQAIAGGDYSLVRRFLALGADPDVSTYNHKETALTLAINRSCGEEVVRMLLESGADVNAARDETTPLMCAANKKQDETVRMLLDRKADVNATNSAGRTALGLAILSGTCKSADLLIDSGADVNAVGPGPSTPLYLAIVYSGKKMVRLLLDKGADVNLHTGFGQTPLMIAARLPWAWAVTTLLNSGARVNSTSFHGETALMFAFTAWRIDMEMIRELLLRGADPNIGNSHGHTALDYARNYERAYERPRIVRLLLGWGAI